MQGENGAKTNVLLEKNCNATSNKKIKRRNLLHYDFFSINKKWDRSTSLVIWYTKSDQNRNFTLLRNKKLLNVYPDIKTALIRLSN